MDGYTRRVAALRASASDEPEAFHSVPATGAAGRVAPSATWLHQPLPVPRTSSAHAGAQLTNPLCSWEDHPNKHSNWKAESRRTRQCEGFSRGVGKWAPARTGSTGTLPER